MLRQFYSRFLALNVLVLVVTYKTDGKIVDFVRDAGGIPDTRGLDIEFENGKLLTSVLQRLQPGDRFIIPNKTFHTMGGIQVWNIASVTIQIDGTLVFSENMDKWPRSEVGSILPSIQFNRVQNVSFTSSGRGTLDGRGGVWWGIPGIGYIIRQENRPKLFNLEFCKNILVENILFKDSPDWTFWAHEVDGLEVRHSTIQAYRVSPDRHTFVDLTAFNTDGFDVTGRNVWVHDSEVWNQDDSFCVKDHSENMLFERINASGLGLTIGSISGTIVRNITFRNVHMRRTVKGIYIKFRAGDLPGLITDVLYENIVMEEPQQWPIWIGPAQQADSGDLCHPDPCSLCWPQIPFAQCNAPAAGKYANITLRNILIWNPKQTEVGVIMANPLNPMENITFDGVRVITREPGGRESIGSASEYNYFKCDNVHNGRAIGGTWPVPYCFSAPDSNVERSYKSDNKAHIHL